MSKSRVFTADNESQIVAEYQDGKSLVFLARKWQVEKGTIMNTLARHGITVRKSWHKQRFTPEQVNEICSKYTDGVNVKDIAREYHCNSTMTIYRTIKRAGNDTRLRNSLDINEEQELVNKYENGEIGIRLAKEYHVTLGTVYNILERHNVSRHLTQRTRYQLDDTTFDHIDTQGKAYILGFIYADGYSKSNTLKIDISAIDVSVLEYARVVMKTDSRILCYSRLTDVDKLPREYAKLQVTSQYLANRMVEIGIVPRRSNFYERTLPALPESLYSHFIRGLIDGDGSYSKPPRMSVRVYERPDILSWVITVFHKYAGTSDKVSVKPTTSDISTIGFSGKQCIGIVEYLYQDAEFCLPRKKSVVDSWK